MRYLFFLFSFAVSTNVLAADSLSFSKTEVVYGRKDGMALTMTVLTPKQNSNGKAIISVLSGNWVSSERMREGFPERTQMYIDRGYTVFGVMLVASHVTPFLMKL